MKRSMIAVLVVLSLFVGRSAPTRADVTPGAGAGSAATSAPVQTSSDLPAIMEKYANAIGGRKLLAGIKSQEVVFTFNLLGRSLVVRTITKAPSSFLQVTQTEFGAGKIVIGFDGKTAWSQGPDGVTQILSGVKRAEVISDAAGGNNSELFPDRWPTTTVLKPNETIDGKQYVVLGITAKSGITHDLLLDSQTYTPVIDRTVESDATAVSVVNSFSKGPMGELQPQSITTTRSDGFPQVTATLQSVHDNVTVSDSVFAPLLGKGTETI